MNHSLDSYSSVPLVNLDHYSGPLDLLLHLIRQKEMDIFKIDIYKITKEYVEYLQQAPQPSLEKAGDFIRMASWLIYIKSKSLLPKEEQEESADFHDLKKQLSQLLISYQKFQKIAQLLYARSLLGRDCWNSAHSFSLKRPKEHKIDIDKEKGLFQLSQFYHQSLISRKAKEQYKISQPIPSLLHHLKQTASLFKLGFRLKFNQLALRHKSQYSFLLSFLSILELSKAGFVSLFQKQLFSNIEIFVKKPVTESALSGISSEETENNKGFFKDRGG
ncbi:MAG: segregation/condensation protein A [Oligoflexia bacterium]|nr:segregation/condensation protein A [Oligoflexia bacterium]